ncbi:MAG: hypothetical protein PWR29_488, partial [Methanolobus sp.]|nr:hypothetical protein [Methanolobus sp.]
EDVARVTGLSFMGAKRFLQEMTKKKVVIYLGFGSSMYTRSKL